jgi:hypothetical protein
LNILFGLCLLAHMIRANSCGQPELRAEFAAAGIVLDDMTGFAPCPGGGFMPIGSLAINYAASGGFR